MSFGRLWSGVFIRLRGYIIGSGQSEKQEVI